MILVIIYGNVETEKKWNTLERCCEFQLSLRPAHGMLPHVVAFHEGLMPDAERAQLAAAIQLRLGAIPGKLSPFEKDGQPPPIFAELQAASVSART